MQRLRIQIKQPGTYEIIQEPSVLSILKQNAENLYWGRVLLEVLGRVEHQDDSVIGTYTIE